MKIERERNGKKERKRNKEKNNKKPEDYIEKVIKIRLINIQGITDRKNLEIEETFFSNKEEYNIVCLTETQQKIDKIRVNRKLENFKRMRDEKDKKGGGLQIMMERRETVKFEQKETRDKNILEIEGRCMNMEMKIILVYMDVNKGKEGQEKNEIIRREIEEKIERNEKEGLIILGDFNGHLDILEDRKEDENGKMVMEWTSTYGLILLNAEEKCSGKYTWSRGEQKSAIDFVLVNENMYKRIQKMEIDEEQEVIDYSDHNLITVTISMEQKKKEFKKK